MNESITIVPCLATCTVNKYKSKGQFSYKQKSNNFVRKEMFRILNHPIIVSGRQVTRLLYKRVSETYFGGNSGGHVFFALLKIFRLIRIIMWVFLIVVYIRNMKYDSGIADTFMSTFLTYLLDALGHTCNSRIKNICYAPWYHLLILKVITWNYCRVFVIKLIVKQTKNIFWHKLRRDRSSIEDFLSYT